MLFILRARFLTFHIMNMPIEIGVLLAIFDETSSFLAKSARSLLLDPPGLFLKRVKQDAELFILCGRVLCYFLQSLRPIQTRLDRSLGPAS